MAPETVLITGASSGIGLELARCFAADGSRLALVARSGAGLHAIAEELKQAHKIDVRTFPLDLSRADAAPLLLNQLQTAGFKIDVLVNNAGFGAQGRFWDIPTDRLLQMVEVNISTLTHLTRLLLPNMISRRRGGVLNVASTAAFQPGPYMALYYATKAYVLSLSEALAEELKGTGVVCSALCPGPTRTNFGQAAGMKDSPLMRMSGMSAEAVARLGHQGFRQGRAMVIPGWRNGLLAFSVRFAPRSWVRRVTGALNAAKER